MYTEKCLYLKKFWIHRCTPVAVHFKEHFSFVSKEDIFLD